MLRGLFEGLFRELSYEEDNKFDWILRKQTILQRRDIEEEAERRQKAQEALIKANTKNGKKNQAKLQLMEEEERKRKDEEEKKKLVEDAKQAAQQKDLEQKGQKSTRMILHAEAERMRYEVRYKINERLVVIMKQEEENARKQPEEEDLGQLDEELMQKLLA